jgi:hypothetical protein
MRYCVEHSPNIWRVLVLDSLLHAAQTKAAYGRSGLGFLTDRALYECHGDVFINHGYLSSPTWVRNNSVER